MYLLPSFNNYQLVDNSVVSLPHQYLIYILI